MLGIAADQTDGCADRVGDIEIRWSQQLARASQRGGQNRAATPDEDHGDVATGELHPIDCVGYQKVCRRQHLGPRSVAEQSRVAHHGAASRHGAVRHRQDLATEHTRLLEQAIADALWPELARCTNDRAAAERDRDNIGHPEVRLHAAELDAKGRLARKALGQRADVRARPTDIDHQCVGQPRQDAGPTNRVGCAATDGQYRQGAGLLDAHQRAVVLCQVRGADNAVRRERVDKGIDHAPDDAAQRGVEDRRVLALEQPDAANLMAERNRHVRPEHLTHQCRGLEFLDGILQRERAGNRNSVNVAALREYAADLIHVERMNATVDLDATPHDPRTAVDRRAQIGRPTGERLHRLRGRTRQAQHRHATELAAAQDCVECVRRAKRYRRNLARVCADNRAECLGDPIDRVLCGRRLRASEQFARHAKQHGVRVRTTNVDANPQRAHDGTSSIGTQGPSYPKRSGPAISRPRGVRQTSAHGMPITVTRWP